MTVSAGSSFPGQWNSSLGRGCDTELHSIAPRYESQTKTRGHHVEHSIIDIRISKSYGMYRRPLPPPLSHLRSSEQTATRQEFLRRTASCRRRNSCLDLRAAVTAYRSAQIDLRRMGAPPDRRYGISICAGGIAPAETPFLDATAAKKLSTTDSKMKLLVPARSALRSSFRTASAFICDRGEQSSGTIPP